MRFRYRLDGFDPEWVDAGVRRTAYYTNLPPGRFTFHVIAANSDGVWSPAGADLEFNFNPNVTITINDASPRGWSAKAVHASITNQCGIYMGSEITPPAGLTLTEGVISCN